MIKFDYTKAFTTKELLSYQSAVTKRHQQLHEKTGLGNDYLGWLSWPADYDQSEFQRVIELAKTIREQADVLLVCGIGGSYLGSRSAIEMLNGLYGSKKPEIIFIGNTFSSTYLHQVMEHIQGKSVYLNVISKSGTTTETALAFRIFKQYLEQTYGLVECQQRIIATTDKARGTLKSLADTMGYSTFTIPDDIGGRYSVLTSVGLLPIAVAGIDVEAIMEGAAAAMHDLNDASLMTNPAYQYAVGRRILEKQGKQAEMLVTYEPQMVMLAEWWKQLFGESEGKEGKGLLPTSCCFSTDLHSMGQFIQEGTKCLFETLLLVEKPQDDQQFPLADNDLDQMNYLAGKSVDEVNKKAALGTLAAHYETGKVPNMIITIEQLTAYNYGYLVYFFFVACAMSAYLLDINPFNQPGVEVYKKNMFRLLGKN
ncbi:Glucose-6-phosphate isomerase [bioreactor metagenome]|uniref:glucose-6-phosphate isomerase n=1 Tax=bioreactor metagenome TaxID=1076179 RepID=A0A645A700_9ZZZZ